MLNCVPVLDGTTDVGEQPEQNVSKNLVQHLLQDFFTFCWLCILLQSS